MCFVLGVTGSLRLPPLRIHRAAFQFGLKVADGRRTKGGPGGKSKPKTERDYQRKLDRDLNKINKVGVQFGELSDRLTWVFARPQLLERKHGHGLQMP